MASEKQPMTYELLRKAGVGLTLIGMATGFSMCSHGVYKASQHALNRKEPPKELAETRELRTNLRAYKNNLQPLPDTSIAETAYTQETLEKLTRLQEIRDEHLRDLNSLDARLQQDIDSLEARQERRTEKPPGAHATGGLILALMSTVGYGILRKPGYEQNT